MTDGPARQAKLLMAMMDSGDARIEPTDPDDGVGVAWIRVMDAAAVAADSVAAALARAEAAEVECAELNDALDAMRMTADEVQARQRGRVQAGAWAQAAAAVQAAIETDPEKIARFKRMFPTAQTYDLPTAER